MPLLKDILTLKKPTKKVGRNEPYSELSAAIAKQAAENDMSNNEQLLLKNEKELKEFHLR